MILERTGRSARRTVSDRIVSAVGAVVSASVLAACDPPPPPESRPVVVVATSSVRPDVDCALTYEVFRAGRHPVEVLSDQVPAVVRILDEAGAVVFEGRGTPEDMQDMPAPTYVEIPEGTYTVECRPEGEQASSRELRVGPARPGYEDIDPEY